MKRVIGIVFIFICLAATVLGEQPVSNIDHIRDLMMSQILTVRECAGGTMFVSSKNSDHGFPDGIIATEINGKITSVRMVSDNVCFLMSANEKEGSGEAIAGYLLYCGLLAGIKNAPPCMWWHLKAEKDPYAGYDEAEMFKVSLTADSLPKPEVDELEAVENKTVIEWATAFCALSGRKEMIETYCHIESEIPPEKIALAIAYMVNTIWKSGDYFNKGHREEVTLPDCILIQKEDFGVYVDALFSDDWMVMAFEGADTDMIAGYFYELIDLTNIKDEPYLLLYFNPDDNMAYPYGEGGTPSEEEILNAYMYMLPLLVK